MNDDKPIDDKPIESPPHPTNCREVQLPDPPDKNGPVLGIDGQIE